MISVLLHTHLKKIFNQTIKYEIKSFRRPNSMHTKTFPERTGRIGRICITSLVLSILALLNFCGGGQTGPGVPDRLNNSPRHQEWITIDTPGGTSVSSFIVFPEVDEPAASVVLIHENRGLTDWVRTVADRLSEAGYIAISPDLLSEKGPGGGKSDSFTSGDDLRKALAELTRNEIDGTIRAVIEYLRELPAASGKVSVAGFCWGGRNTFNFAVHGADSNIDAAFVFYGTPPETEMMSFIQCPVYGFYGENDNRVTSTVEATTESMASLDKIYEPVIYPGAGHGFMRSGEAADADAANREAFEKGWERFLSLLGS
jgi:carboxymethylenebutenolidase